MYVHCSLNVDPVITHDFPMSQFEEVRVKMGCDIVKMLVHFIKAFRVLMSGEGCKVIMTPNK